MQNMLESPCNQPHTYIMNHNIIKYPSATRNQKSNDWKVSFGSVKSIDVSDVHFKPKAKANPYIRGKRHQKLPGVNLRGMTDAEAY